MNHIIQFAPGIEKIAEGSLYPYQADGVAFLLSKKRAILADDMGLGKTRQAIVAMEAGCPDGTVLVVCPASLKFNWRREILMVDSDASIEVLGADKNPTDTPRWIIVNYDLLGKYTERLQAIDWAGIILDEAHFIKNASKRTSHCLKLLGVQAEACAPVIGPEYVFLLTGTPMTNRPKDLFNLFRCVGHPASRSFLSFAKRFCDAYRNDYGWERRQRRHPCWTRASGSSPVLVIRRQRIRSHSVGPAIWNVRARASTGAATANMFARCGRRSSRYKYKRHCWGVSSCKTTCA